VADRKPTPDIFATAPVDVLGDVLSAKPTAPKPTMIATANISTSGGTQMRAGLDQDTVADYSEKFAEAGGWGAFPPVVVFFDGSDYWLADGFHRIEGYRRAVAYQKIPNGDGFTPIPCDVRTGTRRDAILFAASANSNHGLRRTNADKRRSVDVLLRDPEWSQWSDREIARVCEVSDRFVNTMRHEMTANGSQSPTIRIGGDGRVYNTANIGTAPKQGHHVAATPAAQPGKAAYWAPQPSDVDYENETVVISDAAGSRQKSAELAKCTVCHRPLSDPASAVAGVGPCCAAKRAAAAAGGGDTTEDDDDTERNEDGKPLWQWSEDECAAYEQKLTQSRTAPQQVTIINGDSQQLTQYATGPFELVVTSPPYNVGIEYDQHDDNQVDYLPMLAAVWRECYQVMSDGARIAVVVPFGVGRSPYVPFDSQIIQTLVEAGFTIRGRIIWDKNTTGNRTSWGSFRLPSSPALRDTTECIIVAHKGADTLEIPAEAKQRDEKGTYTPWLADSDYFMELAQDHWIVAPESAQRIGHPAPFPAELVTRLVHFYAYPGAHLLDPFAGSGTVGVVAKRLGCTATLVEKSANYCELAKERISHED